MAPDPASIAEQQQLLSAHRQTLARLREQRATVYFRYEIVKTSKSQLPTIAVH